MMRRAKLRSISAHSPRDARVIHKVCRSRPGLDFTGGLSRLTTKQIWTLPGSGHPTGLYRERTGLYRVAYPSNRLIAPRDGTILVGTGVATASG